MSSNLRVVRRQVLLNIVHEFCTGVRTRGKCPTSKNLLEGRTATTRPCAGGLGLAEREGFELGQ
jgi:hypothetical protein